MSAFDSAVTVATEVEFSVFADAITVDGVSGRGIITPNTDLSLGGGVNLYNGARLCVLDVEFPTIAVNANVIHGSNSYIIAELDDVDPFGWRRALIVRS